MSEQVGKCPLSQFLLGVLLERWKKQRLMVEPKWRRNYAAYRNDPVYDPAGTWKKPPNAKSWQSDTFPDLTRQKCNSGFAMATRVLLQGNRVNFSLLHDALPVAEEVGQERTPEIDAIAAAVDAHQALIDRQMEFCDGPEELGTTVRDAAIYGEGYVEEFATTMLDESQTELEPGLWDASFESLDSLAIRHVSLWDVFRDREAKTYRDGDGYAIRTPMSAYDLHKLMTNDAAGDAADATAIKAVLELCRPTKSGGTDVPVVDSTTAPALVDLLATARPVDAFKFHARVPRSKVDGYLRDRQAREERATDDVALAAGVSGDIYRTTSPARTDLENALSDSDGVEIVAIVANGRIVWFSLSEPEERRLRWFFWELPADTHYALGVADAVETAQKSLMIAFRALEDKLRVTSALILYGNRAKIDGDVEELSPNTFLELDPSCRNINEALGQLRLEADTEPLHAWIGFVLNLADMASLIPRVAQGQNDGSDPNTLGEILKRLEQAGEWMLSVIRNADRMTEDIIRSFYKFNMLNPAIPPAMKGNFKIKANGSTSMQNRLFRATEVRVLLAEVLASPDLKALTNLKPLFEERVKASQLDPLLVVKTVPQMQAEAAQLSAQPVPDGEAGALQQAQLMRLNAETQRVLADAKLKETQALTKKAETVAKLRGPVVPQPADGAMPAATEAVPA